MKTKLTGFILGFVVLFLMLLCILSYARADRTGPEIAFDDDVQYSMGDNDEILLKGVTAHDKKDGDVSDTLTVLSTEVISDGTQVEIKYAAKDNANNITEESRIITYQKEAVLAEQVTVEADSETEEVEDVTEAGTKEQTTTTTAATEAVTSTGTPVLKLATGEMTIKKGDTFEPMKQIQTATDDKDNAWTRVSITGDYDVNVPGDYTLEYVIRDTDGNKSEVQKLILHVVEG